MRYLIYCRKSSEAEERQALSLDSQKAEIDRAFRDRPDIQIVGVLVESKSAKTPGRVIFNEMLERIKRREADGIIAWHPDRLARNSVDGGLIIYLLDRNVIKDLKFANFSFENSSQGKFMLQIMFGYSKYYVDNLSENVKRGNRAKIERGWRPSHAPLGYINDKETKTIIKDPVHFPLIRKMYELILTGRYSPKQIALIARDEWGSCSQLAFINDVRTWVSENRDEARDLSNTIKQIAAQAAVWGRTTA